MLLTVVCVLVVSGAGSDGAAPRNAPTTAAAHRHFKQVRRPICDPSIHHLLSSFKCFHMKFMNGYIHGMMMDASIPSNDDVVPTWRSECFFGCIHWIKVASASVSFMDAFMMEVLAVVSASVSLQRPGHGQPREASEGTGGQAAYSEASTE